jgi:hypothetical protein
VTVDIDITGVKELRLLVSDVDSYSPERVVPVWAEARLTGPAGAKQLGDAEPVEMKDAKFSGGLRAKVPSEQTLNIDGQGYTRFQAVVGVEANSLQSDINPKIRFFVFDRKPDMEQLVQAGAETPVAQPSGPFTVDTLTTRIYRQALSREPTPAERQLARGLLSDSGKISAAGLSDLLWCILMLPEFQLIQ